MIFNNNVVMDCKYCFIFRWNMKIFLLILNVFFVFIGFSQQNTFDSIYDFDDITIPNQDFIKENKIKSVATKSFSYYIENKDTIKDLDEISSQLSFEVIKYFNLLGQNYLSVSKGTEKHSKVITILGYTSYEFNKFNNISFESHYQGDGKLISQDAYVDVLIDVYVFTVESYHMKPWINYIRYSCDENKSDGNYYTYTSKMWAVDTIFSTILNETTYRDTTFYSKTKRYIPKAINPYKNLKPNKQGILKIIHKKSNYRKNRTERNDILRFNRKGQLIQKTIIGTGIIIEINYFYNSNGTIDKIVETNKDGIFENFNETLFSYDNQ